MHNGRQRQAVAGCRCLIGPSQRDGGNGHDEFRQLERTDDLQRLVNRCAEKAEAQSCSFGQGAKILAKEQCVGRRIDKRKEIAIPRRGFTLLTPGRRSAIVGTKSEHHGGLRHHRLVEMSRGQLAFLFFRARHNNAVELQISHSLRVSRSLEQAVQQLVVNGRVSVSANGTAF